MRVQIIVWEGGTKVYSELRHNPPEPREYFQKVSLAFTGIARVSKPTCEPTEEWIFNASSPIGKGCVIESIKHIPARTIWWYYVSQWLRGEYYH